MKRQTIFFYNILCMGAAFSSFLVAGEESEFTEIPEEPTSEHPWLTGPIIAPPAVVVPVGHFSTLFYFFANALVGEYDAHWRPKSAEHNLYNINPQALIQVGVTKWMDIAFSPQVIFNKTQGQSSFNLADLLFGFDFQLYSDTAHRWFPGIKLSILETFPTGKYQKLNPHKKRTDITGGGSYATQVSLEMYKIYAVNHPHFLSFTFFLGYTAFTSVSVRGFNAYGGGYHTHGTVHPGDLFQAIVSFEYTLTKNWALAIDNVYTHRNRNRFSGRPGFTDTGIEAAAGEPSSESISFAPAIEYNFSQHFGIIAGAWVSAWGRNSPVFRNLVVNFNLAY